MSGEALVIIAIIGFLGQTMAVILAAVLTQRSAAASARAATKAASDAEEAKVAAAITTSKAAEDAAKAQTDAAKAQAAAAEAAQKLVEAAQLVAKGQATTEHKIDHLQTTADGTHVLVNNQRTVTLKLVAKLARRIADENPMDKTAQEAADAAEAEAAKSVAAAAMPGTGK